MTSAESIVALNALPNIGPIRVKRLVERFGSAEAVLRAPAGKLRSVAGIGPETAETIRSWEDLVDPGAELRRAREMGVAVLTPEDEGWPAPLREIYDAPLVLYVWGSLDPGDRHAIGVVGSRRATHYGRRITHKLSFQLARAGFTVVSGLARGIDTAAHEAAIAANGRTIAVVGSGLCKLYPPENFPLAEKIASGFGAVVTEFPLDTAPSKQTFPMRNRIVAGWAQAILVTESPGWSGSLITANLATEYGRPVFAVPGQADQPSSEGCHKLIRNGATLVTDAAHLLDDLGTLPLGAAARPENSDTDSPPSESGDAPREQDTPTLPPEETAILEALGNEETPVDLLIERTGLPAPTVTATLMKLEIARRVRQLPGFRYARR